MGIRCKTLFPQCGAGFLQNGFRLGKPSKQTVYCWVNNATIPHHKPSQGRLAFRKSEIDKWLGIETLVYNSDLDDEDNKPLLPKSACGTTISRKGGYK